jgi:hypothetical protein
MVDKLPPVHDRVWELLQRMRDSVDHVGWRHPGSGQLQRPALERPRVDRHRSSVQTSDRPAIYSPEHHRHLKNWISGGNGIRRLLRGPDAAAKDQYDNHMYRRRLLVSSLRAAAGAADGRYDGMKESITDAWITAHLDPWLDDLCDNEHLPPDAAQLRLGWQHANATEKQRLLADIHPNAPTAYAFAGAVGERSGKSAEHILHLLNNAPGYATADTAAGLLMDGSERMTEFADRYPMDFAGRRHEVAELIRTEWDNATPGDRIAELATELIGRQEQALDRPQASQPLLGPDPRLGMPDPSGAVNLSKATVAAAATGKKEQSHGIAKS